MDIINYDSTELSQKFFNTPSNVGGGLDTTFIKYDPSNVFINEYKAGLKQYKSAGGRLIVHKGGHTWGNTGQTLTVLQPTHSGEAGVLQQFETPSAYLFKAEQNKQIGAVDPNLPRGGSMMRVVDTENTADPKSYNVNFPWASGGVIAPAGKAGPAQGPGDGGPPGFGGGRYDNPDDDEDKPPKNMFTQTDGTVSVDNGAQTDNVNTLSSGTQTRPEVPNINTTSVQTDPDNMETRLNDYRIRVERFEELTREMDAVNRDIIQRTVEMLREQTETIVDQLRTIEQYEAALQQSVEGNLDRQELLDRLNSERRLLQTRLERAEVRLREIEDQVSSGWTPSGPPPTPTSSSTSLDEYRTGDSGSFENDSGSSLPSYGNLSRGAPVYADYFFAEILDYITSNYPGEFGVLGVPSIDDWEYLENNLQGEERTALGQLRARLNTHFNTYILPRISARERGEALSAVTRAELLSGQTLFDEFGRLLETARRQQRFMDPNFFRSNSTSSISDQSMRTRRSSSGQSSTIAGRVRRRRRQ